MSKHLAPKPEKDSKVKFNFSLPKKNSAPAGRHSRKAEEAVDEDLYDENEEFAEDAQVSDTADDISEQESSSKVKMPKISFSLPKMKSSSAGRHSRKAEPAEEDGAYQEESDDEAADSVMESDVSDPKPEKPKITFSLPKMKAAPAGKHSRKPAQVEEFPSDEESVEAPVFTFDTENAQEVPAAVNDEVPEEAPVFDFRNPPQDTDTGEEDENDTGLNRKIEFRRIKKAAPTIKATTESLSAFIQSNREGLAGVAVKDSYREHLDMDTTDAVIAGVMAVAAIVCMLIGFRGLLAFGLALIEVVFLSRKLLIESVKNIRSLSFFHEGIILLVCVIGGFCTGNPQNAVLIVAAWTLAGFFRTLSGIVEDDEEDYELEDVEEAWVRGPERVIKARTEDLKPGNTIYIDVNSEIPVDGIVLQGSSKIDRHKLSHVMMTTAVGKDDYVYAGDINISGQLCVKVLRRRSESAYYDIQKVKNKSLSEISEPERKFAVASEVLSRIFVFLGLAVIICSLFFKDAKTTVQTIGVCLLMLSCTGFDYVPNVYKRYLQQALSFGTIFSSKSTFDNLGDADTIAFDKTGIITENTFKLVDIKGNKVGKEEVLRYAAAAEYYSTHPIAKFLKATVRDGFSEDVIQPIEELPGFGVGAIVDGHMIYVGNERLLRKHEFPVMMTNQPGVVCHVSRDNEYLGYILLSEIINEKAYEFTESLKSMGMGNLVMMTGSSTSSSKQVVKDLSIDLMKCELLPEEKIKTMEYLDYTKKGESQLVYLNRGSNVFDIAVKADISISIAGLEEKADINASDIYLFNNDVSVIPGFISASRKASGIIRQNRLWIVTVNAGALILTCFGIVPVGVFALVHFGVSTLSYFNTMRKAKI